MTIEQLFLQAGVTPARLEGEAEVASMTMDSRRAKPGTMFVAMPPASEKSTDSNSFIPAAHAGGASSVLTYSVEGFKAARKLGMSTALLPPDQYQDSIWRLAKIAFGNPSASMKVIGVTGTNGKTTTAWLIRDMLQALGIKAAYLGTLGFQLPGEERELQNTTPFAIELNELLAEARDKGVEAIAMEVSSHALAEKRVDGVEFDVGVFTNLTQDHLDFHGSMEAYEAAKLRLFTELPRQSEKLLAAVINTGDPAGERCHRQLVSTWLGSPEYERWRKNSSAGLPEKGSPVWNTISFSAKGFGMFSLVTAEIGIDYLSLVIGAPKDITYPVEAHLGGSYNVENLLAAIAAMFGLGMGGQEKVQFAASRVRPVPGRFEPVPNDAEIGILVDYAHTPDALEKLLDTVRDILRESRIESRESRIITVFGCGGDRDRTKRPKMAKAASERSDVTVITSDNPRTEDPVAILKDVAAGIEREVDWSHVPEPPPPAPSPSGAQSSPQGEGKKATVIVDRREAIAYAIKIAKPGDVVIAGKGHENYQIIGRTKFPMDDRELAREGLAKRKTSS